MRSLSLTRSSPAPVTCMSPPCVASAASAGSSSMRPGTSPGPMRQRPQVPARRGHRSRAARRLDAASAALDPRADAAQHVEQRRAGRVQADVGSSTGAGQRCGGDGPERRRGEVARHGGFDARQSLAAVDETAAVEARGRRAERRQRPLRVIACRAGSRTVVVPSACKPASRMALLTCALGTGGQWSIGRSTPPREWSAAGRRRSASMRAPIGSSGSITRRIGRRAATRPRRSSP